MNLFRNNAARFAALILLAALVPALYGCNHTGNCITAPTLGPGPAGAGPSFGAAGPFEVLGGSTVTNTGATTIVGSVGVSPGSSITGLPAGQPTGGSIHAGDATAATAQTDLTNAYNNLAARVCNVDLTGVNLGGKTLTPNVYCFSTSAQLTGTLTLDGLGNSNSVFVFQIGSTLTTAGGGPPPLSTVVLTNGAQARNVYWQVGTSATIGVNSVFMGNILSGTGSITVNTGASITGRVLAQAAGAVTLDTNALTLP